MKLGQMTNDGRQRGLSVFYQGMSLVWKLESALTVRYVRSRLTEAILAVSGHTLPSEGTQVLRPGIAMQQDKTDDDGPIDLYCTLTRLCSLL